MKTNSININEPCFGSKKREHHSSTSAALVGASLGGALGYAIKTPVSARAIYKMDSDAFSNSVKNNDLHPIQQMQAYEISSVLKSKEEVKIISEEFANKLFEGKDKISTEEYLKKNTAGHISSPEQLKKIINKDKKGLQKLRAEYARKQTRLAEVAAQKDLNKIELMTESVVKTARQFHKLKDKVIKYSEYQAVTKRAIKGEISKKSLLRFSEKATKRNLLPVIRENMSTLASVLPKAHSVTKALKFAGIGALATVIINKIIK